MTALDRTLAAVVAHGLPGAPAGLANLRADDFDVLLANAAEQRVVGHLVAAIDSGALAADDDQRARAHEAHHGALALDLLLERLLVDTTAVLAGAGIAHRALKGPVLAHTVYADPALRSFGDVDVLVDGARFDDAVAALARGGGRRRYREPRPHFMARFGKGVCVETGGGLEVDVHRVFVSGPFGLAIDPADLFATADTVRIGGVDVPALDPTLRFLHACYHASLGGRVPRLSALRDVAETARDADPDRALALAARWRGRAVVQRALDCTRATLPAELAGPLFDWAAGYTPDRFETTALRAYVSERRSYAVQAFGGVWAIRGVRARAAYARALLVPTRDYVGEREGSYTRRWRRGLALARRWRRD